MKLVHFLIESDKGDVDLVECTLKVRASMTDISLLFNIINGAPPVIVAYEEKADAQTVRHEDTKTDQPAEPPVIATPSVVVEPTSERPRRGRPPKVKPTEEPTVPTVVEEASSEPVVTSASAVVDAPKAAERKVDKVHNGEFSILTWIDNDKHIAQIEVGQDPAISGLVAEAGTATEALASVCVMARKALAEKQALVPDAQSVPDAPFEVPDALLGVTSFHKVIDWMVDPAGGGFSPIEDHVKPVGDWCIALKPHIPVIGRVGGDIYDRVRRRFAVIAMERAQAV